MEFESILFKNGKQSLNKQIPDFFHDLQLDYLLNLIKDYSKIYSIEKFYYTIPKDFATICYRHEIYKDLTNPKLQEAINSFCISMQRSRKAYDLYCKCDNEICLASYHLEAALCYWNSLIILEKAFSECKPESEGLKAFYKFIVDYLRDARADGWENDATAASRFFSELNFSLIMETDKITILEEKNSQPDYLKNLANLLGEDIPEEDLMLPELFPNELEPSFLEIALVQLLSRSRPELFKEILDFYNRRKEFYSDCILRFEQEVQFYLTFQEFVLRTQNIGYMLNMPNVLEKGYNNFSGQGIYDLALAWRTAARDYQVVANDFSYPENFTFFVVTGPNQGGKTTFARSMGQAVYFSLMGLPVNAKTFYIPFFKGIVTHFEAEEKMQSNSGKLKEEIDRLAPMMQYEKRELFVILNELFTTATTYDASIMGKKVMEHFLRKSCYGIYVTHIQELAEERDGIISLTAQVEEGEEERRTYKILPKKAEGHGYSDSLVKQFELRYEDIIRRLS